MSAPSIVGFSGYARSGKDTAAQALLVHTDDLWYLRVAFADELKYEVAQALNLSLPEFMERMEDPEYKTAVRPLLVEWGRFRRYQRADYWIERAAHTIMRLGNPHLYSSQVRSPSGVTRAAITDVRYANEAAWIRGKGGVVIGVERPGVGPANDEERRTLAEFKPDFIVVNSGTVEALHAAVAGIVLGGKEVCNGSV